VKALNWLGESTFPVWIKPRAARNKVMGLRAGALHVHVSAPPIEGKANQALVRFLAEVLGVRRAQVEIISGWKSRRKVVRITEVTAVELRRRVAQVLEAAPS
jgi:uncharacterized protein (TIGR00251 family)